jgi:hypothetical protein
MQIHLGSEWRKAVRRNLRTPVVAVVAAIVLVLVAAWFVIQSEAEHRATLFPLLFGHK